MFRSNARRRGLTLIELLVVVFVIALLIALILPAVQSAREASRRLRCANNLRQVGIALGNYASSEHAFPPTRDWWAYSYLVPLLPYLEQKNFYDSLNLNVPAMYGSDLTLGNKNGYANYTTASTRLALLICPSDSAGPTVGATTSYAANVGYGFERTSSARAGAFEVDPRCVTPGQVTDGLSNTVGVSEWIQGAGLEASRDRRGNVYFLRADDDFERFVAACDAESPAQWRAPQGKFCLWWQTGRGNTLYDHNQNPNKMSCANGSDPARGSTTSASRHPGGVNSAFLDGHVARLPETIGTEIWRSLATRAGGEPAATPD